MLGEFHATVRALEVIDFIEELYVRAASLLGLPVAQGGRAEIHAPNLSHAFRISSGGGDVFGDDIY